MIKFIINIIWIIIATPLYLLIIFSCIYVSLLNIIFQLIGKEEPYKWVDELDSWVYNVKEKYL